MKECVQNAAMWLVDIFMALVPRPVPGQQALRECRIISHRGEHDNKTVMENTLAAFRAARDAGVWGIECDIRWTADLVPVISHDPTGERIFGDPARLDSLSFAELRARLPLIPSLAELVTEFGGRTHLMLEVKDERYPQPALQKKILQQALSSLLPAVDYHFLALDLRLFERVDFVPSETCLPVCETNVAQFSSACIAQGYGGLTGHYLLLSGKVMRRHAASGQCIGTGYADSKYCLFRELNRGVEWIFSNHAVKIQGIRNRYLVDRAVSGRNGIL
jgi:glycerophosphoryl diester phosphodiesterase